MPDPEHTPAASSDNAEQLPLAGLSRFQVMRSILAIAVGAVVGGAVVALGDYFLIDRGAGLAYAVRHAAWWALLMFVLFISAMLWIRRQSRHGRRSRLLDFLS
jgi:hypothetical protein